MAAEPDNQHTWSPIVGDLQLPPPGEDDAAVAPDPNERVPVLIELNARYPGGLRVVRQDFYSFVEQLRGTAGGRWPVTETVDSPVQPHIPEKLAIVAPSLYQCVLSG